MIIDVSHLSAFPEKYKVFKDKYKKIVQEP